MKEHPILFSTEMVQAILECRKTQTRRIFKGTTEHREPYNTTYLERWRGDNGWKQICPYGRVGDRLWVRETWRVNAKGGINYKAEDGNSWIGRWKPSIFMPRWASRITLEITGIRVESLQDITDGDVDKEGYIWNELGTIEGISFPKSDTKSPAQRAYKSLWNKINGKKHSWESNPWVWVIEFKKI